MIAREIFVPEYIRVSIKVSAGFFVLFALPFRKTNHLKMYICTVFPSF